MKKSFLLLCLLLIFQMITSSQNVGIGTNAPSEKLEVVGNIKADSGKYNALRLAPNAGNGKILTSDALGNASWQSGNLNSGNAGYGAWGDCATNANISDYNPVADPNAVQSAYLGLSTSVSGNFAIVGAWGENVSGNSNQGAANIYQFDGSKWVLFQKITDPAGTLNDRFGYSVSISGNYIIVGAWGDDGVNVDQGSACIFHYNGTSWVYIQKVFGGSGATGDFFGISVCIDGNYAIVGAYRDDVNVAGSNKGSATIFKLNGALWAFMQKISDVTGAASDEFGFSVSISGNYAIAGAHLDDVDADLDQGTASIFMFNGVSWVLMQKIIGAASVAYDEFGSSVSISGNDVVIGSPEDDVVGNSYQGMAYVYHYNGTSWVYVQQLIDPEGAAYDYMGNSVSISGNYILVGLNMDDVNGVGNRGSVIIYKKLGYYWQRIQKLTDPGFNGSDMFGASVSIDGNTQRFVVGATNYMLSSGKAVFGKVN